MKAKLTRSNFIVFLLFSLYLLTESCKSDQKKPFAAKDSISVPLQVQNAEVYHASEQTWIDDFRSFREAVSSQDIATLQTFFKFPFADNGSVLNLCELSEDDWLQRKLKYKDPSLFYQQDLKKYHSKIFNRDFVSALLSVKADSLYQKHEDETKLFENGDHYYKLYVNYHLHDKVLVMNVLIGNNFIDDDGNHVSEGEHNTIYTFSILKGKKLILDRVDLVG